MAEQETERKLSRREQRRADGEEPESEPKSTSVGARGQITPGSPSVAPEPTNRRERRAAASGKNRSGASAEPTIVRGLDASELVDDALARSTDKTAKWLKRNFNVLQWVLVGGIAVWIGYQIYDWRADKSHGQASGTLMKGVTASLAKLQAAETEEAPAGIPASTEPTYKTTEERVKAAREAFEQTIAARPKEGTAVFAQLGLASLALDEGKFAEARGIYEQVKTSKLAEGNPEVRGRALEGIALSFEGESNADAALKAYQELENTGIDGFKEGSLLAQARLQFEKGNLPQAREIIAKLKEHLAKEKDQKEALSFYLQPAVNALASAIDPNAPPPEKPGAGASAEDLEKLQELIKNAAQAPSDPAPAAPSEAPADPAKTP